MRALAWTGLMILVTACGAGSPFIVTDEVHEESLSQEVYEPHRGPVVCVTVPLPDGIRYAEIVMRRSRASGTPRGTTEERRRSCASWRPERASSERTR